MLWSTLLCRWTGVSVTLTSGVGRRLLVHDHGEVRSPSAASSNRLFIVGPAGRANLESIGLDLRLESLNDVTHLQPVGAGQCGEGSGHHAGQGGSDSNPMASPVGT